MSLHAIAASCSLLRADSLVTSGSFHEAVLVDLGDEAADSQPFDDARRRRDSHRLGGGKTGPLARGIGGTYQCHFYPPRHQLAQ